VRGRKKGGFFSGQGKKGEFPCIRRGNSLAFPSREKGRTISKFLKKTKGRLKQIISFARKDEGRFFPLFFWERRAFYLLSVGKRGEGGTSSSSPFSQKRKKGEEKGEGGGRLSRS